MSNASAFSFINSLLVIWSLTLLPFASLVLLFFCLLSFFIFLFSMFHHRYAYTFYCSRTRTYESALRCLAVYQTKQSPKILTIQTNCQLAASRVIVLAFLFSRNKGRSIYPTEWRFGIPLQYGHSSSRLYYIYLIYYLISYVPFLPRFYSTLVSSPPRGQTHYFLTQTRQLAGPSAASRSVILGLPDHVLGVHPLYSVGVNQTNKHE